MKRSLIIVLLFLSLQCSFAAYIQPAAPAKSDSAAATTVAPPDMNNLTAEQKRAFMEQFSKMSVKEYEKVTGRKLNAVEKLSFKLTQNRLKHQLRRADDITSGFNIGGFALGFLLGLLGVLLAYIFSKDANFRKWTRIGFGVWVVILLIILAVG